jgi:hypothetical protein
MEGLLCKQGHVNKSSWKNRWFVLEGNTLTYYTDQRKSKVKGKYTLSATSRTYQVMDTEGEKFLFQL